MLFVKTGNGTFEVWSGGVIDGETHHRTIEHKWSFGDLAAKGLYIPAAADPVPAGKASTGQTVQEVDGVVKWVHTLEDAPAPTGADVNLERARRVQAGTTVDLGSGLQIKVGGDDTTVRNLQGLAFGAQLRLSQGDTSTRHPYRDETNAIFDLTPAQIIALWQAGAGYVSQVFAASWALKDGPAGIPANFADDSYWQ